MREGDIVRGRLREIAPQIWERKDHKVEMKKRYLPGKWREKINGEMGAGEHHLGTGGKNGFPGRGTLVNPGDSFLGEKERKRFRVWRGWKGGKQIEGSGTKTGPGRCT